jgi:hypothetical protein
MKSIIKLLAASALVLAMFSQPRDASAADVFHFTGQAVDGTFVNVDLSGCMYTSVDLVADEQIAQTPPDAAQPSGWISVHVFQADFCTNTVFHTAIVTVPLSESELELTGNLHLATLHTTVSLVDYVSKEPFDVAIDLTWTATNPRRHENTPGHYNFGGCHLNYHYNTAYRIAEVSGTVSVGTTNYRPELSELWGTIFSTKYGEVFHGCN